MRFTAQDENYIKYLITKARLSYAVVTSTPKPMLTQGYSSTVPFAVGLAASQGNCFPRSLLGSQAGGDAITLWLYHVLPVPPWAESGAESMKIFQGAVTRTTSRSLLGGAKPITEQRLTSHECLLAEEQQ